MRRKLALAGLATTTTCAVFYTLPSLLMCYMEEDKYTSSSDVTFLVLLFVFLANYYTWESFFKWLGRATIKWIEIEWLSEKADKSVFFSGKLYDYYEEGDIDPIFIFDRMTFSRNIPVSEGNTIPIRIMSKRNGYYLDVD